MVAQVPADAVQFMQDFDPVAAEIFRPAHARQLQKLRRVERAAAKDNLAVRRDGFLPAADPISNAPRPFALEFDFCRVRFGDDRQIGAAFNGMKIGGRGRATLPGFVGSMELGHLVEADPFLARAVEVVVGAELQFVRRLDEGVGDGRGFLGPRPGAGRSRHARNRRRARWLPSAENREERPGMTSPRIQGGPIVIVGAVPREYRAWR